MIPWQALAIQGGVLIVIGGALAVFVWVYEMRGWPRNMAFALIIIAAASFIAAGWFAPWSEVQ